MKRLVVLVPLVLGMLLVVTLAPAAHALSTGDFKQVAKLIGAGATGTPRFGQSVALSADGKTLLLGGPVDDQNLGAVWVFTRTATGWKQQGPKLTPSSGGGSFGHAVALSAGGDTALVGGPDAGFGSGGTGAAWVFSRFFNV